MYELATYDDPNPKLQPNYTVPFPFALLPLKIVSPEQVPIKEQKLILVPAYPLLMLKHMIGLYVIPAYEFKFKFKSAYIIVD